MNIGDIVERECKICHITTHHVFDGMFVTPYDRQKRRAFFTETELQMGQYTCSECHGTFNYNVDYVTRINKRRNERRLGER